MGKPPASPGHREGKRLRASARYETVFTRRSTKGRERDPMTHRRSEVGRVAGPHGVWGMIRVKPYSKTPSGLLAVRTVRLSAKGGGGAKRAGDFEVRTAQPKGGFAVFSLGGVDTPEEAKEWAGGLVSVLREAVPPPAGGEYS